MPRIVFIEHGGRAVPADARPGQSVMQAATDSGVDGMPAECGGACACGTCHVYVDGGGPGACGPMELEILQFVAAERTARSRLACQMQVTAAMEGLVVYLPPSQH